MINVNIDEDLALDMLMNRLEHWIKDHDEDSKRIDKKLYEDMYDTYLESGAFDGGNFDPMMIVDNDYINYCEVIEPNDEDYETIDNIYKENGACDISESNCKGNRIESACEYKGETYYLIRY